MKRTFTFPLTILTLLLFASPLAAQEEARAAWQITSFDITANVQQGERLLSAVANLAATNVGRGAGTQLTFRINAKATVKTVTVAGANASFRAIPESSGALQRVTVTLPASVAPNASVVLMISYSFPVESNSGLAAISSTSTQFLPLSFWYPAPNTPFTIRGADTAPVRLTVNGPNVIAAGIDKSSAGGQSVYELPLNGQPFFVQGDWERVEGAGDSRNITAFLPRGTLAEDRKQAESIVSLAANARAYFAGLLGPAPEVPIRIVAMRRGSGFSDGGTILLEPGAFRRAKVDSGTGRLIGEAVARLWIGGQAPIRGEGNGLLRDALTRFLAVLFIEKQFGKNAAQEELLRQRLAFSTVAKKDGPLARTTPLDATYFSSVPNKGAMVWRLVDQRLGRDAFMMAVRSQVQAGKDSSMSLAGLRTALIERGGEPIKLLMEQQLDQVTDMDLMIGVAQQRGTGESFAALRNIGANDAVTTVRATTATGEQLSVAVTVPARNFGEAVFKTGAKIVNLEVDPEKLYPQLDYANDNAPRTRDIQEGVSEAARQLGAQDFVKAESVARELLVAAPLMQEARILLGRAFLGQNRNEEAEKIFRSALEDVLPNPGTLAWANIGLGEIALKKGQAAEAARRFNDAVRADAEYASSLVARAGRIRAEVAANTLQVDAGVKTFVGQMDQAITRGKKVELETMIVSGELVRFITGIVGTQPEVWQTKVLRTEALEANLMAADVSIETKELGRQESGTAVLLLARVGGGWKLAGIDMFEVR